MIPILSIFQCFTKKAHFNKSPSSIQYYPQYFASSPGIVLFVKYFCGTSGFFSVCVKRLHHSQLFQRNLASVTNRSFIFPRLIKWVLSWGGKEILTRCKIVKYESDIERNVARYVSSTAITPHQKPVSIQFLVKAY